jgi:hypothetical protein
MAVSNIRLETNDSAAMAAGVMAAESAARNAGIGSVTTSVTSAGDDTATLNLRRFITTPTGPVDHLMTLNISGTPAEIQRIVTYLNAITYTQDDHEYKRGIYSWQSGFAVAADRVLAAHLTPHVDDAIRLGIVVCAC